MKKTLIMFAAALLMLTIVLSFAGCRKDPLKMEPAELEKYCSGLSAQNFWKWYNGLTEEEQFKIDAMLFITDFVYPPDGSSSHIDATAVPNEPNEPEITPEPTPEPTPDPAVYRREELDPIRVCVNKHDEIDSYLGPYKYIIKYKDGTYQGIYHYAFSSPAVKDILANVGNKDFFFNDCGYGYWDDNGDLYCFSYTNDSSEDNEMVFFDVPGDAKIVAFGTVFSWADENWERYVVYLKDSKLYYSQFDKHDKAVYDNEPEVFYYDFKDDTFELEVEDIINGLVKLKDGRLLCASGVGSNAIIGEYDGESEYTLHLFDASSDTIIDNSAIPYFYEKGGDAGKLWFEDQDDAEYAYNMPEGHSLDDLDRIIRVPRIHDFDFKTNFDYILLVFKNGEVYKASAWDLSVRGNDVTRIDVLCELSDHIVDIFFDLGDELCVLMDDNIIYTVNQ
ncbi:MAG: hypothetical protein II590_05350 [Clostridia bacterium]|nr:hypothetical protein [Clostridia bacterium]